MWPSSGECSSRPSASMRRRGATSTPRSHACSSSASRLERLAQPMREVARLPGFEAVVGAITDDTAPVLVLLAQLAVAHRVEQRRAPRAVLAQRVQNVRRDLEALEQLEAQVEQLLTAVVVGPAAVRVAEVTTRAQQAQHLDEEAAAVVVEMRCLDVDDDVERSVREVKLLGVADLEREPCASRARAREPD